MQGFVELLLQAPEYVQTDASAFLAALVDSTRAQQDLPSTIGSLRHQLASATTREQFTDNAARLLTQLTRQLDALGSMPSGIHVESALNEQTRQLEQERTSLTAMWQSQIAAAHQSLRVGSLEELLGAEPRSLNPAAARTQELVRGLLLKLDANLHQLREAEACCIASSRELSELLTSRGEGLGPSYLAEVTSLTSLAKRLSTGANLEELKREANSLLDTIRERGGATSLEAGTLRASLTRAEVEESRESLNTLSAEARQRLLAAVSGLDVRDLEATFLGPTSKPLALAFMSQLDATYSPSEIAGAVLKAAADKGQPFSGGIEEAKVLKAVRTAHATLGSEALAEQMKLLQAEKARLQREFAGLTNAASLEVPPALDLLARLSSGAGDQTYDVLRNYLPQQVRVTNPSLSVVDSGHLVASDFITHELSVTAGKTRTELAKQLEAAVKPLLNRLAGIDKWHRRDAEQRDQIYEEASTLLKHLHATGISMNEGLGARILHDVTRSITEEIGYVGVHWRDESHQENRLRDLRERVDGLVTLSAKEPSFSSVRDMVEWVMSQPEGAPVSGLGKTTKELAPLLAAESQLAFALSNIGSNTYSASLGRYEMYRSLGDAREVFQQQLTERIPLSVRGSARDTTLEEIVNSGTSAVNERLASTTAELAKLRKLQAELLATE